jgi:hypothetical protein
MTEVQKKISDMFEKTKFACLVAVKHSRVVFDFRVMTKKEFDEGWGKTHSSGCVGGWNKVKKTHRYVGVLTIKYCGQYLHYAVSHREPVFAAALVLKYTLEKFNGKKPDPMHQKIMRVHKKFFDVVCEPPATKEIHNV